MQGEESHHGELGPKISRLGLSYSTELGGKATADAGAEFSDAKGLTGRNQFRSSSHRVIGCHDFPSPFTGPAGTAAMAGLLPRAPGRPRWTIS
ncbi:hypothetical protein [Amycolatopsis lexingtonensis]|uniref:hypothetical protein n=1 Tax=Amycolatopsis lexingtonensis TaxID=218822 RepID=UPI003F71C520